MMHTTGKRSRTDGQITKEELAALEAQPSSSPGAFCRADPLTLAARSIVHANRNMRPDFRREFHSQVRALNTQFAQWVNRELGADASADLTAGLVDYNVYVSSLEERYLRAHGVVLTFGSGDCGQLGIGCGDDDKAAPRPRPVPSLRSALVAMVACGGLHNVVCTAEGRVFTWGCNDDGALGRRTDGEEDEATPREVIVRGEVIRQVAAGDCQTLAVALSGAVYGWGCYKDKEGKQWWTPPRGAPARSARTKQETPIAIECLSQVAEVKCGASANIALLQDGSLRSWGIGECSELGRAVCAMKTASGEYDYERVLRDHLTPGHVYASATTAPSSSQQQQQQPAHVTVGAFKTVGCGAYHTLAITASGARVFACGLNNYGQLGTGDRDNRERLTHVAALDGWGAVSAVGGAQHTLALCADGAMLAWGRADYGQLGAPAADAGAGGYELTPHFVTLPPGAARAVKIAAGANHSLCVTEGAEVYTWGFGDNGVLGHGEAEEDVRLPRRVDMAAAGRDLRSMQVVDVSGGGTHSAIVGVFPQGSGLH